MDKLEKEHTPDCPGCRTQRRDAVMAGLERSARANYGTAIITQDALDYIDGKGPKPEWV